MTKYFCDKCRQETAKGQLLEVSIENKIELSVDSKTEKILSLCISCIDKLHNFLRYENKSGETI